ncbi:hypothetical protein E2320_016332 [Naja naja]|nr:hypothetical protein E2320_016332 [Naja naja]
MRTCPALYVTLLLTFGQHLLFTFGKHFTGHSSEARNEPDVYETHDLPEDDQAEFDALRMNFSQFILKYKIPLTSS